MESAVPCTCSKCQDVKLPEDLKSDEKVSGSQKIEVREERKLHTKNISPDSPSGKLTGESSPSGVEVLRHVRRYRRKHPYSRNDLVFNRYRSGSYRKRSFGGSNYSKKRYV